MWRIRIQFSDLVYYGGRSPVIEYLTARGWRITAQTLEALLSDGL